MVTIGKNFNNHRTFRILGNIKIVSIPILCNAYAQLKTKLECMYDKIYLRHLKDANVQKNCKIKI